MKKSSLLGAVCVTGLLVSNTVNAFTIITDEALFNSLYINPTETITFDTLKDGTTYTEAFDTFSTNPLLRGTWGSDVGFGFNSNAFSDNVAFSSYDPGNCCGGNGPQLSWNGSSIGLGNPRIGISVSVATPIAMQISSDVYTGFYGIVPDNDLETFYDVNWSPRISFMQLGFQAVPIPAAAWLFGSGLLGLIGAARRRCKK